MTSFLSIQHYSPAIVLVLGILTFIAYTGSGLFIIHVLRVEIPSPWRQPAGIMLGTLTVSLIIQLTAMAALIPLWEIYKKKVPYRIQCVREPAYDNGVHRFLWMERLR